ncbi:MAG: hypothetical protein ABFE13_25965 [Phycisphaerales bacterium]
MSKQRWAILLAAILLGTGLLWLVLGRESIQEGRCRLRLTQNADIDPITHLVSQTLSPLPNQPTDIKDVPPEIRRPSYYYLTAGERQVPLAVDFSGNLKMCLDADADGMLSDERCYPAHLVKGLEERVTFRNKFGPLLLAIDHGEQQGSVRLSVLSYRRDKPGPLRVYPSHYRSGRLRLGGKVYAVALIDGDYDGFYKTPLSLPFDLSLQTRCDVLAIDLNGDDKFDGFGPGGEISPLTAMVAVNGRYYAVHVADNGEAIELPTVEPPEGHLAADSPNASLDLKLWSDAANQVLSARTNEWSLPVGRYQTVSAILHLYDPNGNDWTFPMGPDFGALQSFEIQPDHVKQLRAGPPFLLTTNVEKGDSNTVLISPALAGCTGEEYRFDFGRNGRRPPERTFKIVDEKGTVLVADKFQYG